MSVTLQAWLALLAAAVFEIGWPLGFKLSQTTGNKLLWITVAIICMGLSGVLLWLAQRQIPIGIAYAVWTGIGAAGTFAIGVLCFGDAATAGRMAGAALIVAGVVLLKIAG
ncbi:DMT family transporter [Chitinilyticum aquatile]|uniref:DMT family transporter n=1 Tax=Chitinilyticum aquatile TaxID=362520 RepID=UPI00049138FF|nr:SMR family transporter [Chitinilyticum aquatile]